MVIFQGAKSSGGNVEIVDSRGWKIWSTLNYFMPITYALKTIVNHVNPFSKLLKFFVNHSMPITYALKTIVNHVNPFSKLLKFLVNYSMSLTYAFKTIVNHASLCSDSVCGC